jgi:response regulator RpfG family c-di-GMP phosphodiesterase
MKEYEELARLFNHHCLGMHSLREDPAQPSAGLKKTVMIVDDNIDIILALREILKDYYHLVIAYNFEQVVSKMASVRVDLILLDIRMARVDGIGIFKAIKLKNENIPVIFHSASPGDDEKVQEIKTLPHQGYLTKGDYSGNEVLAKIREELRG